MVPSICAMSDISGDETPALTREDVMYLRVDELDRELSAREIVLSPEAQKPEKQITLLDAVDKEVAGRQGKLLATTLSPIKRTGSPTQDVFDPRQNVELSPRNLHVSQTMENLIPLATGTRPEDRPHHSSKKKTSTWFRFE